MDNKFDNNDPEKTPEESGKYQPEDVEKTFVEGSDDIDSDQEESHPLQDGESFDASNVQNPYKIKSLPTGEESIQLGSGTIKGMLGQGGMAKVYKIWNDDFEMYRAVKLILPGDNEQNYERFKTEIKITAKLQNPNIIQIYNIGEWQGLPYIEMEYIEGITLTVYLETHGKLENEICVSFAIQIANALNYAHNCEYMIYGKKYKGIIHRDLKPDNIMVSQNRNLKLMDFGIARPTETGLHTMTGHFIGSPQYMAPEQFDGGSVDNRSDIYSLGAILYEMLSGEKAFPGEKLQQVLQNKALNSYKSIKKFDFKVNPSLANLTEKCMHKNKDKRYQSADQLLADLQKIQNNLTSSSTGPLKITEAAVKTLKKKIEKPITTSIQQVKKHISNLKFKPKLPQFKPKLPEAKRELPWKKIITGSAIGIGLLVMVFVIIKLPKKAQVVAPTTTDTTEKKDSVKTKSVITKTPTVFVKGGSYMMGGKRGKDDELPAQKMTVDDFHIGQYEVTNKEYLEFLNSADISPDGSKNDIEYIDIDDPDCAIGYKDGGFYFKGSKYASEINCPVIEVTWYGAHAYCLWKNCRLPTEAEWEYACRAGTKTKYYWGNKMDSSYAWFGSNSGRKTHPIGKKKPNALELYDMIGNVWEWCGDLKDKNYYEYRASSDTTEVTEKKEYVLRGGSSYDLSNDCRITKRLIYDPHRSEFLSGFRVVLLSGDE
jgi:serine/threonine protein kinase